MFESRDGQPVTIARTKTSSEPAGASAVSTVPDVVAISEGVPSLSASQTSYATAPGTLVHENATRAFDVVELFAGERIAGRSLPQFCRAGIVKTNCCDSVDRHPLNSVSIRQRTTPLPI